MSAEDVKGDKFDELARSFMPTICVEDECKCDECKKQWNEQFVKLAAHFRDGLKAERDRAVAGAYTRGRVDEGEFWFAHAIKPGWMDWIDRRIVEVRTAAPADALAQREAERRVCSEIQAITATYREQAASGNVDTPGGLEHMGDVWSLLRKWDAALEGKGS